MAYCLSLPTSGGTSIAPGDSVSPRSVESSPSQLPQRWVNVSHILAALPVGLEPLTLGTWNVFFGPVHLGWLDERDYRIHDPPEISPHQHLSH